MKSLYGSDLILLSEERLGSGKQVTDNVIELRKTIFPDFEYCNNYFRIGYCEKLCFRILFSQVVVVLKEFFPRQPSRY